MGGLDIALTRKVSNMTGISIKMNAVELVEWVQISMTLKIDILSTMGVKVWVKVQTN